RPGRGEAPGGHAHRRRLEEEFDHRPRRREPVTDVGQAGPQVAGFEDGQADGQADVAGRAELVVDVVERAEVHDVTGLGEARGVDRRHVDRAEVDDGRAQYA